MYGLVLKFNYQIKYFDEIFLLTWSLFNMQKISRFIVDVSSYNGAHMAARRKHKEGLESSWGVAGMIPSRSAGFEKH